MKFRAYDPSTDKMYYPPNEHIYLNIDGTCINFQNGEVLEVMFETGQVDHNGKKCYDCDVWQCEKGINWVIFWSNEFFCWGLDRINKDKNKYEPLRRYSINYLNGGKIIRNTKQNKLKDFT